MVHQVRERLGKLELNDAAVWEREHQRSLSDQAVTSPWWIKGAYLALCIGLDVIYAKRPIQRFWFLETVARMPYFSYISMLHLYESLGWWRAGAELRKVRLGSTTKIPATCKQMQYALLYSAHLQPCAFLGLKVVGLCSLLSDFSVPCQRCMMPGSMQGAFPVDGLAFMDGREQAAQLNSLQGSHFVGLGAPSPPGA